VFSCNGTAKADIVEKWKKLGGLTGAFSIQAFFVAMAVSTAGSFKIAGFLIWVDSLRHH